MDVSARFSLPLLLAGQVDKESQHNEALQRLELAVQASVVETFRNDPPANAGVGDCYLVGAAPQGAWAGQASALAGMTSGGWRFVAPVEGMRLFDQQSGRIATYRSGAWSIGLVECSEVRIGGDKVLGLRAGAIASPQGGTVIDVQARDALGAILQAMRSHGLIAS